MRTPAGELIARRRVLVQEQRMERDDVTKEVLQFEIDEIDRELALMAKLLRCVLIDEHEGEW